MYLYSFCFMFECWMWFRTRTCGVKLPNTRWKSRGEQDVSRVTRKLQRHPPCPPHPTPRLPPPTPTHLETDSSPRQPSPHLILGCPVVMFFNYVSLFNVATAHPYLVNRCNFSCRVEMQPVHPGIKGQIELPQARTHTHTHTHTHREGERERFTFISIFFRLHLQFEPQQGDFQHAKQLSRKNGNLSTVGEIFYF